MSLVKVNFGCGMGKIPGWLNVDLDRGCSPDAVADLGRNLPFANASVDLLHSEDFISQLTIGQGHHFLRECRRILKPTGVMRLLTPDLEKFVLKYLREPEWLLQTWDKHVGVPLTTRTACEILNVAMQIGGRFQYDRTTFVQVARECGLRALAVNYRESAVPELRDLDLRPPEDSVSMYFDCYPA